MLDTYDWPGNIRELQNIIERAVVMASGSTIQPEDLHPELSRDGSDTEGVAQILYNSERKAYEQAMIKANGNYRAAAKLLRRPPEGMHRILRRLDLLHLIKKKAAG